MNNLSRRTVLRAGSATLLLPLLESQVAPVFAASTPKPPKRLIWVSMGYGVNAENWIPSESKTTSNYKLPSHVESFADLKEDISFIQNLTNRHIHNPHAGSTSFLTCVNTKKDRGRFYNSVSCDQLAARVLGEDTRHSSLAIGSEITANDGHGDRFGYASWQEDGKPVGTYRRLLDVYQALFGTGSSAKEIKNRLSQEKSSLDLLKDNAKRMNHKISISDRDRVDEYFTSIRNIEVRLSKAQAWADTPFPESNVSDPFGLRGKAEIELAFDLMHAAIQSDSTRVMTYMLPSRALLKELGSNLNPHKMSHKAAGELDPDAPHQKRDRALAEQVSRFIRKLKETKEFDGRSLLDYSLVAYGSALRQGHNKVNSPMILAGRGGGGIKQGRNVVYEKNVTPMANLWLSMIRHAGVEQESFADSNSVLSEMGFS